MGRVLKIMRVLVSLVVFMLLGAGITCTLWLIPGISDFLSEIQLGPAILGLSLTVIAVWLLLTILFGRIYCSTVCPMGVLMDISARIPKLTARGRRRVYRYDGPDNKLRGAMLIIALISALVGFNFLLSVLDPYSVFCRICNDVCNPILAFVARKLDGVGLEGGYAAMAVTTSVASSIFATLILVITMAVSMMFGRTICNTMCPVGTILGAISRYSIYQFDIDTDLCTQCRKCESVCKSRCIDMQDHVVDSTRCVVCFNCVSVCPNNALRYTTNRKRLSTPLMQRIKTPGRQAEPTFDSANTISKNLKK